MATVTREREALQAFLDAMRVDEDENGDCPCGNEADLCGRCAYTRQRRLVNAADMAAAALASPPAEDETRELAIARHALALIEPHTTRGITDCSTPLHIRVQNIVEGLEKAEREIERLKALAQPNRGDAIRLTACMAGFKPCADCQHREFCRSWLDGVGRCVKAQAPPASDPPGLASLTRSLCEALWDIQSSPDCWCPHDRAVTEPHTEACAAARAVNGAAKRFHLYNELPLPASPQAETKGDE